MKYFLITVDTEGDNLWEYRLGNPITTENARYLPRFQNLCNNYGYKPVYLTNYEMVRDDFFVKFVLKELSDSNCEIGLHLHAWNSPPYYELSPGDNNYGLPYLIEYPRAVMNEKTDFLLTHLRNIFNTGIVSHRAGRWAMNRDYFDILAEHGIEIDCSITPHISWENKPGFSFGSKGSDYTTCPENPFITKTSSGNILEMPVTIRRLRILPRTLRIRPLFSGIKEFITRKPVWLRPNGNNLQDLLSLIKVIQRSDSDYLMFMIHSSELMPGGSPTFKTEASIEKLYQDLKIIFTAISKSFAGIMLKDYAKKGICF
jgi:hypothetical protein